MGHLIIVTDKQGDQLDILVHRIPGNLPGHQDQLSSIHLEAINNRLLLVHIFLFIISILTKESCSTGTHARHPLLSTLHSIGVHC